jgi:DNA repair protein RecN (Recombination protein N)
MLRELFIEDFALIERLKIEFGKGLNILTGETGAGKSIIIDALSQVIGNRASAELVRSGTEKAVVSAVFSYSPGLKPLLAEAGLEDGEEQIILQREIWQNGKSQARINNRPINVTLLREAGQHLLEIHGQHEHQALLNATAQLDMLDTYGGKTLQEKRVQYQERFELLRKIRQELSSLHGDQRQRQRTIDLLQFQIQEIAEANLTEKEDQELLAERKLLLSAQRLLEACEQGYQAIYQGEEQAAAAQVLGRVIDSLSAFKGLSPQLDQVKNQLQEALYQVEDAAREMRRFADGFEFHPERLQQIEERLDLINNLKRKYADSIPGILKFQGESQAELKTILNSEARHNELLQEIEAETARAGALAGELSKLRREAAATLARSVEGELAFLQMARTRFEVDFNLTPDQEGIPLEGQLVRAGKSGADEVQFLISPNPGEPLKPLAKIASGGEMSRIMLAILNILAGAQQVGAVIFDEIDAGIGGRAAQAVAERLAEVSTLRQVICVSHLPQVTSMADNHFHIFKETEGQRTRTRVNRLDIEDRVQELARMLGGAQVTEATLRHAREMIKLASQVPIRKSI